MAISKIYGLHSVKAALDYAPLKIKKVWCDGQRQDQRSKPLIEALLALGLEPEKVDRKRLDRLVDSNNHQGWVIEIEMPAPLSESDLKMAVERLTENAFLLILDQVQDPHNLGACLRTADAVGVQGVIITKDNSAGITPTVCKVACGAAESVPVYQVTNLSRTLRWLKEQGVWLFGAASDGSQMAYQVDLTVPLAFVVGAEGKGLRHLTREQCDVLINLPMSGQVASLNLSVAAGVLLYEGVRQRLFSLNG
jgi:23S rRNA (guanosine2251-2'-O)-methyltransferase